MPDDSNAEPIEPLNDSTEMQGTAIQSSPPSSQHLQAEKWESIPGFRIERVLGEGGMGRVYLATDLSLERPVAIKVMKSEIAHLPEARERFFREARSQAAINHPNIVPIWQISEQVPPYLVMPFLEGETLDSRLRTLEKLPLREVLLIGEQIARGLYAAHARSLIHRDIKPANIWLESPEDKVMILDFGLARRTEDQGLTHSGAVMGTPQYMSPEQASGKPLDHRSDLFSLGVILYRCLSGKHPFRGDSIPALLFEIVEKEPSRLDEIVPDAPQALVTLVHRLLAKNRDNRPASAKEVVEVLHRIRVEPHCTTQPLQDATSQVITAPEKQLQRGALRNRGLWIGLIGFGLLLPVSLELLGITRVFSENRSHLTVVEKKTETDQEPQTEPKKLNQNRFVNPLGMEFVFVGKGEFRSGGFDGMVGDQVVKLDDFYIGVYEVTHSDWDKVMGAESNPGAFRRQGREPQRVADLTDEEIARLPVNALSLAQARRFVQRLNEKFPDPEWKYALPTPLQWEYACRGGPNRPPEADGASYILSKPTNVITTNDANILKKLERTMPVGSFPPNPLGLYDMHGNVAEYTVESETIRSFRLMGGYFAEVYPTRCQARYTGFGAEDDNRAGYAQGIRLVRVKK